MKTFWKTYVVLAVGLGLAAYAYFVESKRPATAEGPAKDKLIAFETAKARELQILPAQGDAMTVVKEGAVWKMTGPLQVSADLQQVDSLLSILERTEIESVVEAPKDLKEFGLDPPELTIGLVVEGQTETRKLLLGGRAPGGASIYAKRPNETRLLVVSNNLRSAFETKPMELRDRDILHVKAADVSRVEVSGPEGGYTLERKDGGDWALTAPVETQTNRWRVDNLMTSLEHIRMDRVAAESAKDLKPYGLVKPIRTVTLTLKDGATRKLEIGALAPAAAPSGHGGGTDAALNRMHFAREGASPLVAVIPNTLVSDLELGLKGFRAGRLLDVSAYEVTSVEVELDGKKQVYARSTSKDHKGTDQFHWKRTSPDAKDLEPNVMQDLLTKVGGLEAEAFVDKPEAKEAYGLNPPALKATLTFEGRPSVWFELGEKGGEVYGRRPNDVALLKLGPAGAELLNGFKGL